MSDEIERAIREEDWEQARRLIQRELVKQPDSHWLLTRLGLTYYEQCRYGEALVYEKQALSLAPDCPLVLWDYAGTLEMLDRPAEALAVFQQLVARGVEAIASGPCGEGRGWARGLIADCHYRMADCLHALSRQDEALQELDIHLDMRGPGCYSMYPLGPTKKKRVRRGHSTP